MNIFLINEINENLTRWEYKNEQSVIHKINSSHWVQTLNEREPIVWTLYISWERIGEIKLYLESKNLLIKLNQTSCDVKVGHGDFWTAAYGSWVGVENSGPLNGGSLYSLFVTFLLIGVIYL